MQDSYWFFRYLSIPKSWWNRPSLIKKIEIDTDDDEAITAKLLAIQEATELEEQSRHGFTFLDQLRGDYYEDLGITARDIGY